MSRRVCCCAVLFQILIVVSLAHDAAAFWGGRGGAAICTAPQAQHQLAGIPDGTGGAIFAWTDRRDEVESQIYAQRFDASGSAQWGTNGIMIASFASNQDSPTIATDDAGGAIIVWSDTRILSGRQIFAQKINPMGNAVWSPQGVRVCPGSAQTQRLPRVIPDGAGGAFTAWEDYRYGATPVAWTQRLDANGTILWGTGGKQPTPSADPTKEQGAIAFVTDAAGGFIITFHDHRGFGFDIYAQRMAPDGSLLRTPRCQHR